MKLTTAPITTTAAPATANTCSIRTGKLDENPFTAAAIRTAMQKQIAVDAAILRMRGHSENMRAQRTSAHGSGDDEFLDLVRALVDLRDLRVPHVALDRVLGDVAVAAEDLHGLDRDRHGGVGGEELGHRGVLAAVRL